MQISPHIPLIDKSIRNDGTWTGADFEWDTENDQYIRPQDHALQQFRRNYSDANHGPTGKSVAGYQALKYTCEPCPTKIKCCPHANSRKITREEHEGVHDVARAIRKTLRYKVSSKLRRKVERLVAHFQRISGLGRLRLGGPCGANEELFLAATAQNFSEPQQAQDA